MRFKYSLNVSDYRKALYLGTFLRLSRSIKLAVGVLFISVVYTILGYCGVVPLSMIPTYACIGYMVWGFYVIGNCEHSVLKYVKSPECVLGHEISFWIDEIKTEFFMDESHQKCSLPTKDLFAVFETKSFFDVYLDSQQTVLLPKRAMSAQEVVAARDIFSRKLKERFSSQSDSRSKKSRKK